MKSSSPLKNANVCCDDSGKLQVDREMEFLEGAIRNLTGTLQVLLSRIQPVLRPIPPDGKEEVPEDFLVPLADSIRARRWGIEAINNRLNVVLDHLEI
jgi:hypothetical protein